MNNFALKKSVIAKLAENKISEEKFNFNLSPIKRTVKAVNKLKKRGITIFANGIRILKFSSNVKE